MTKALGFVLRRVVDIASSLGNHACYAENPPRERPQEEDAPVHPRMTGPFCGKIGFKRLG